MTRFWCVSIAAGRLLSHCRVFSCQYPPNMALLVPKLDPKKPHFCKLTFLFSLPSHTSPLPSLFLSLSSRVADGEMCGGLPGVVFPCGGGGLFISLYSLRKSLRALDSCYLGALQAAASACALLI